MEPETLGCLWKETRHQLLWNFKAGCKRGRPPPPPGGLCSATASITLRFRGNSIQAGCLRVREQHQAETAPSSACGLESHVLGVYRVTSLVCANSLLWDILMPLWPLTLEGFLLHLLGKKTNVSFFLNKRQRATTCNDDLVISVRTKVEQ